MLYLIFKGFCFFVTSTFYSMYNQSSKVVSWVDEMNLLGTGLYFIAIIKNITKMYEDFYLSSLDTFAWYSGTQFQN